MLGIKSVHVSERGPSLLQLNELDLLLVFNVASLARVQVKYL